MDDLTAAAPASTAVVVGMKERKLANTRTNISFGQEKKVMSSRMDLID